MEATSLTQDNRHGQCRQGTAPIRLAAIAGITLGAAITGIGWVLVGHGSPFAERLHPDLGANSMPVIVWVLLNLPPSFVHRFLGSPGPSQAAYFLCVFAWWSCLATIVVILLWTLIGRRRPGNG